MKLYGLIGYPLKNTFSVEYFSDVFLRASLTDHMYENFPLQNIRELPSLLAQQPYLCGLNVTIPHKVAVLDYLDELDESAKAAGAVNCINITRDHAGRITKLTGHNTDVFGFEQSLLPILPPHINKALILGTGGAAKAVGYVLKKLGINYLLVSRTLQKTNSTPSISYEEVNQQLLTEYPLIINCTPVGMYPNVDEAPPLPYALITSAHIAFDLIYLPEETLFLKRCKEKGAQTKNGLEMLTLQAQKAWEIWRS